MQNTDRVKPPADGSEALFLEPTNALLTLITAVIIADAGRFTCAETAFLQSATALIAALHAPVKTSQTRLLYWHALNAGKIKTQFTGADVKARLQSSLDTVTHSKDRHAALRIMSALCASGAGNHPNGKALIALTARYWGMTG